MGAVRTTPLRRVFALGAIAAICALALLLAACGGGSDNADLAAGKQAFSGTCGSCHALADAGTTGTTGPNLDDAFRASRNEGFEQSTFEGVVKYWIAEPEQLSKPLMPANLVTGQDADNVAAYVASVAGRSADSPPRPEEPSLGIERKVQGEPSQK